ncbi:MAG: hypothetical protein Q7S61_05500 [bacterium]|nr:hypothetical protein [bacterium]
MEHDPWSVENLVRAALKRTKERFLSYFLTYVASSILFIVVFAAGVILSTMINILYVRTKSVLLVGILGTPTAIGFFVALIYVSAWSQLAVIHSLMLNEKKDLGALFKEVKPATGGYIWLSIVTTLFMFGLIPWGLMTLFIVLILWAYWSIFSTFVYLEQRRRGLENLWISRQMIDERFIGIAGRMLLIHGSIFFMMIALGWSDNAFLRLLSGIVNILFVPFSISFSYEIYRLLKIPTEVKKPTVWIAFSAIGFVLFIVMCTLLITVFSQNFAQIMEVIIKMIRADQLPRTPAVNLTPYPSM